MKQRGKVVNVKGNTLVPNPENVLLTTVCRDAYKNHPTYDMPSSITSNGFQDGFGEYTTHLPEKHKFFTNQRSYGMSFLEENIKGPTYLQYPRSEEIDLLLGSGDYDV